MEIGMVEAVIGAIVSTGLLTQLLNWWSLRAKERKKTEQEGAIAAVRAREISDRAVAELIKEGVLIGSRDAERLAREIDEMRGEIRQLVVARAQLEQRVAQLEAELEERERERDEAQHEARRARQEVEALRREVREHLSRIRELEAT